MEKKHPPTEKKLNKAREEGNSINAPYFVNTIITLGVIGGGGMVAPFIFVRLENLIESFQILSSDIFNQGVVLLVLLVVAVCLVSSAAVVAGTILIRGGTHVSLAHWGRMPSPKKYFSTLCSNMKELIWAAIRGLAVLSVFVVLVWCKGYSYDFFGAVPMALLGVVAFVGFVQVYVSWKEWLKKLMMTDKEMIEEIKEDEGDPHRRSYRKHLHRELSLEERVKRSKVILIDVSGVRT